MSPIMSVEAFLETQQIHGSHLSSVSLQAADPHSANEMLALDYKGLGQPELHS
jgi:hypothetical protein